MYAFFLRWNPERAADPLGGDDLSPRNDSFLGGDRSSSKHDEIPPTKGFVLLATDDPELSDDYRSTNKNDNSTRSTTTTSLSPDDGQRKQPHYLRRQNTLLKEWEVRKLASNGNFHLIDKSFRSEAYLNHKKEKSIISNENS